MKFYNIVAILFVSVIPAKSQQVESQAEAALLPCGQTTEIFDGQNPIGQLPVEYLSCIDGCEIDNYLCGIVCDPWCCTPCGWPYSWVEYTATCTGWISFIPYTANQESAPMPIVFEGCDCPQQFYDALDGCPTFYRGGVSLPVMAGDCVRLALFGGVTLLVQPSEPAGHNCDFAPGSFFGSWGTPLMNWTAFVTCQENCASDSCSLCFDLDGDDDLDLADVAKLQNEFPWY